MHRVRITRSEPFFRALDSPLLFRCKKKEALRNQSQPNPINNKQKRSACQQG